MEEAFVVVTDIYIYISRERERESNSAKFKLLKALLMKTQVAASVV